MKSALNTSGTGKERLLLKTYFTKPEPRNPSVTPGFIDQTSIKILQQLSPSVLNEYSPRFCFGDGNCLYRAVALSLYGSQEHHGYLRVIAAIEMIENRYCYDTNSPIYSHTISDSRIHVPPYSDLIRDVVTDGAYAELMHMYALSAALTIPLSSFCPSSSFMTRSVHPYTLTVFGRGVSPSIEPEIHLMWTMTYVPDNIINFKANHFSYLACLQRKTSSVCNLLSNSETSSNLSMETDDDNWNYFNEKKRSTQSENESVESEPIADQSQKSACIVQNAFQALPSSRFFQTEAAIALLTTLSADSAINSKIPNGVKENVYIVVDNSSNLEKRKKGKKSEFIDDCGTWISNNSQTTKSAYLKSLEEPITYKFMHERRGVYCQERLVNCKREFIPFDPQPDSSRVLHVYRHYCHLKADPQYKKRVTWLADETSHLALVEYRGIFPRRIAHGNAISLDDSYCRTPATTMTAIQNEVLYPSNPKDIYNKMLQQNDILDAPRNTKQIYNKKYNSARSCRTKVINNRANFADEVFAVINMLHSNSFVRSVTCTKNKVPTVILYNNEQISMIKNFCFEQPAGSVLSFDKTFNLGSIYLTSSVFTNKAILRRETSDEPIFIGPIFLHGQSDFETYNLFFSQLSAIFIDCDTQQLILGSDKKYAMRKALQHSFPQAQLVTCMRHLKQNLLRYLQDKVGVDSSKRKAIIQRIFGEQGLISNTSTYKRI